MTWTEISEDVLQLPHQEVVLVPKDSVGHPQEDDIPYSYFAYRKTVPDGRAIDIKEGGDYWRVHWDKHNPDPYLIEHALDDAPAEWLLATAGSGAAIGALISEKGKKGEGALKGSFLGLGVGVLALFLREIARNNQEIYIKKCH